MHIAAEAKDGDCIHIPADDLLKNRRRDHNDGVGVS